MKLKSYIFLILLINPYLIYSQNTQLGRSVHYLSGFAASDYFAGLKKNTTDLALVDTLFNRALLFTGGDKAEALLGLTFTSIPVRRIPFVLPLFKWHMDIPLTSVGDSLFERKNRNLPARVMYDSPLDEFGDKDKLAHFFGSAYLAYISHIFDFTEIIGIFVEEFEEKFYIQSSPDPRDLVADRLGQMFGKGLKSDKNLQPSTVLSIYPLTYFRYRL